MLTSREYLVPAHAHTILLATCVAQLSSISLSFTPPPPRTVTILDNCRLVTRNCGIIGIYRADGAVSVELYEGLLMLQHRGQDSAGMVTLADG